MTRIAICAAGAAMVLAGIVEAAGPKVTSTWKAPEAAEVSFAGKKVAALVISNDQYLRVSGEEALVRELAGIGLTQGVASYRIVPREELADPEKAKGWYERSGVDGVVAMRLVRADARETWTPSLWTSPSYNSLWGYYGYGWGSVYVYDPGQTRVDQVVVVETLIFSVPQNKLLWAAVTESTNPKDATRVIKEIVTETVKQMTKQGLLRKRPK
jgi:CubicO group peptidase (beta-lactamase class C family)